MGGNANKFIIWSLPIFLTNISLSPSLRLNIQTLNCCSRIFDSNIQRGCKSKQDVSSYHFTQGSPQNNFPLAASSHCIQCMDFQLLSMRAHPSNAFRIELLKRPNSNYCFTCRSFSEWKQKTVDALSLPFLKPNTLNTACKALCFELPFSNSKRCFLSTAAISKLDPQVIQRDKFTARSRQEETAM